MTTSISKLQIINAVSYLTKNWIEGRMKKLSSELHDSMSVNPFLIPILFNLHDARSFEELGDLLLAGHLMTGHSTGFGKLIDEKLLPQVFGTYKLDGKYRASNQPLDESCFDDIDHVIHQRNSRSTLLSLKSGKWTIQLASAVGLNRSFAEILSKHSNEYDEIVVGVFYGNRAGLTDKYDILRGINRGKNHNVVDIQEKVKVFVGRDFWTWINNGESNTQDWILDGIIKGVKVSNCREKCRSLLKGYAKAFVRQYDTHINTDGTVNWHTLLTKING